MITSVDPKTEQRLEILHFATNYIQGARGKLAAVLFLDIILSSITGIGLLLVLPLLGLLGFGSGPTSNPIWQRLRSSLDWLGIPLTLETGLIVFILAVSMRALLNWRRQTWRVAVEQQFQTQLRNQLYETLSRTELYRLQQLRTSEIIQSIQSEIRQAQQAANSLLQISTQALNLIAYSIVAIILSSEMTLFALICGAAAFLAMLPVVRQTHELSRRQIRVRSSLINNLIEHIQGLRTARSLGLTRRFVEDYHNRSAEAARVIVRLNRLSAFSALVFELVAVALLAAIVYFGLARLNVEPARFVVILLVFIRIFPSIGTLQNQLQIFAGMLPSFRHYFDLLCELQEHQETLPPHDDISLPPLRHSLELRDVSFSYRASDGLALRQLTLRMRKNELIVIVGESGAGKSTLVDIITGLLPPKTGGLYIDGHLLTDRERILWRDQTALVPQEVYLFNGSVRENLICVKPNATENELWEALDATNSRSFVDSKYDGLDTVVGERGGLLSGGERQRISIARALLRSPQLVVLDEPTNNLDTDSVDSLIEVLRQLRTKSTVLVVSHDRRLQQCADRVFQLDAGCLTETRKRQSLFGSA